MADLIEHHPFCNNFLFAPAKDCKQCKDLRNRYPDTDKNGNNLSWEDIQEKHFPNAEIIK
jgi:hypothetical protein